MPKFTEFQQILVQKRHQIEKKSIKKASGGALRGISRIFQKPLKTIEGSAKIKVAKNGFSQNFKDFADFLQNFADFLRTCMILQEFSEICESLRQECSPKAKDGTRMGTGCALDAHRMVSSAECGGSAEGGGDKLPAAA